MTDNPGDVPRLKRDIEQRSGDRVSRSAEELTEDAQIRHLALQQPPTLWDIPALREPDNPEDGSTAWDKLTNPHALRMVTEAEKTGEPLFCFRARDFFSVMVISYYEELVDQYGPTDADFHRNIVDALHDFKAWQKDNMKEVRYPD